MASRRVLKKIINNSFEDLYRDCIFYKVFVKDSDIAKANEIIAKLTGVQNELLSRVCVSEGKEIKARTKNYYKKVRSDLKTQVDALGKEIEKLH